MIQRPSGMVGKPRLTFFRGTSTAMGSWGKPTPPRSSEVALIVNFEDEGLTMTPSIVFSPSKDVTPSFAFLNTCGACKRPISEGHVGAFRERGQIDKELYTE